MFLPQYNTNSALGVVRSVHPALRSLTESIRFRIFQHLITDTLLFLLLDKAAVVVRGLDRPSRVSRRVRIVGFVASLHCVPMPYKMFLLTYKDDAAVVRSLHPALRFSCSFKRYAYLLISCISSGHHAPTAMVHSLCCCSQHRSSPAFSEKLYMYLCLSFITFITDTMLLLLPCTKACELSVLMKLKL